MARLGNGRRLFRTAYGPTVVIAHDRRDGATIPLLVDGETRGDLVDESWGGLPWYSLWVDGARVAAGRSQGALAGRLGRMIAERRTAA